MIRQELDGESVIPSQDERAYLRLDREGVTAVPVPNVEEVVALLERWRERYG